MTADTDRPSTAMDVLHYVAQLEPDIGAGSIRGNESIRLVMTAGGVAWLKFDAGELIVDSVREGETQLEFSKTARQVTVTLPRPSNLGDRHEIDIVYHGAPTYGLEFHAKQGEVYTIFSTSQWLVCVDAPDERASLDLELTLPAGLLSVGNGKPLPERMLADGRVLHRWRQLAPMPSYLYGFAAGRYNVVEQRGEGARWQNFASSLGAPELRRIFADTGDMLKFFGERGGRRYRDVYRQALVTETIGQEMAGFSLMSAAYGREVLADQTAESLIAHEVAHQWWGNAVTNQSWRHFWLNEGFATFMTAAYMQHRFGEAEYRKRVDGWRSRIQKLRASGSDKPLVFDTWSKPSSDDRAVVYQKGAYVLYLLRGELGEKLFWRGIRDYTRQFNGRSATTADFRRAMERSSGRDLSGFFATWVLSTGGTLPGEAAAGS